MEYAFRNTMTRFLLVFTVLGLMVGTMWAQGGTGELQGLITDPSGAVVANAQVTLSNTATGDKRTTVTTPAGIYRFVALPVVGTYTLETSPKGFKSAKVANIVISVGTVVSQDVKLELGAGSEQVTVEAGVQQVQTSESSISDLVDRRVWQQMPLETRDQNQFINLLAGAAQGNIALNAANGGTDRGAAVNGARSGTGNYMVEGFDNNDQGLAGGGSIAASTGGANTTISPDAIQEYRVIEHNFSAEYGKAGGFVTDTVLKSGTNQWHGSLFEYNRIQALAANSFFSNRAGIEDSLVRNQFGGSVGGPIIKDKAFFYFTTEFRRDRENSPDSGNSLTPDFINFVNSGQFEQYLEASGAYAGVNTAAYPGSPICGTAGCPGAFAQESTLGPIAANLLATQPLPLCVPGAQNCKSLTNTASGLYTGGNTFLSGTPFSWVTPTGAPITVPQSSPLNQARYTAKIDYKIGNNDSLNGAYLYDNGDNTTEWNGGDSVFGPPLPNHARAQNAGLTWSHTFSPTVLNQARVAYTRHTANFPGGAEQNAAAIPSIVTAFDSFQGAFGNSSGLPQFFTENRFEYRDDLSITRGKHNFKTGGLYSRTRNGSSFFTQFNGFFLPYGVEDLLTDMKFSDSVDQAVLGYPAYGSWYYAQASINPTVQPATRPVYYRGYRANEFSAYVQDDWRIHPRLTLNLGVRWDYFGVPHNYLPNLDSNFFSGSPVNFNCNLTDPNTGTPTPVPCQQANQFVPAGNPVIQAFAGGALQVRNNEIWNKDTNNFAPRVGFSYDVTGKQKLVVRGGFGIAYDRLYNNVFENLRFNPPFYSVASFGAFVNGIPGGALSSPGIYTVPFTSFGLFNSPTLFPNGQPLPSPRAINQNLVTAYYEQSNFGFQYEVAKDLIWETNYVGTWGRKLVGIENLNTYPGRVAGGVNPANPFLTSPACIANPNATGCVNASVRPNPTVANINLRTNGFNSNYNGIQTSLRKRFANGLQFDANYTYSKVLDEISDTFTTRGVNAAFTPEDSLNAALDYGPADFNIKHRLVVSYSYDLPFLKTNRWLGGWSVSGIVTAQSGVPFSIFNGGRDTNENGTRNDRGVYIGPGSLSNAYTGNGPANEGGGYINPTFFATLEPVQNFAGGQQVACPVTPETGGGRFCEGPAAGQLSRNSLTGPKYVDTDLSVAKRFKILENAGLTFQAGFFNLFNHPNFAIPDTNLVNLGTTFGQSTATFAPGQGGARVTQLALRFDF
jgi:hypothetical protein